VNNKSSSFKDLKLEGAYQKKKKKYGHQLVLGAKIPNSEGSL
jgi:hypothetical protein